MIRLTVPADTPRLLELAKATGVFKPHEIEALEEVLDDLHATNHEYGHTACTLMEADQTVGFVYYAPTAMTDRTWEIWWIAIDPALQGGGRGARLLEWAEQDARRQGCRLMLIDTSGLPNYAPTRGFYLKFGYAISAQIKDFYADGDDKVIFWKKLAGVSA